MIPRASRARRAAGAVAWCIVAASARTASSQEIPIDAPFLQPREPRETRENQTAVDLTLGPCVLGEIVTSDPETRQPDDVMSPGVSVGLDFAFDRSFDASHAIGVGAAYGFAPWLVEGRSRVVADVVYALSVRERNVFDGRDLVVRGDIGLAGRWSSTETEGGELAPGLRYGVQLRMPILDDEDARMFGMIGAGVHYLFPVAEPTLFVVMIQGQLAIGWELGGRPFT